MKEFLVAHAAEVIAAIMAVGVFVGPLLASWRQRKNTEQERKLRAHFEQLKREATPLISLASNLAPMYWKIVVREGKYREIVSDFEKARVSPSFEVHFSEQSRELGKLTQKIREHNTNYEDFRRKIRGVFDSKGIPVEGHEKTSLSTYVREAALDALFSYWGDLARGNQHPSPDFQSIESKPVEGGYFLYVSGWGGESGCVRGGRGRSGER
jgi:hypothetical protein